jgi:large subunit ribosomal protein L3
MIPAILGKKVGMTQIYSEDGRSVPVTVIAAGPCVVTQVKTADGPDGYHAVQLGYEDVKPHRSTLPQIGHARKANTAPKRFAREIRLVEPTDKTIGETVTVDVFSDAAVKWVDIAGTTRGKGFQGGMKRWGFGGQSASHGVERKHRSPGSIGGHAANTGTGTPKKGKRMAGRTGGAQRVARCQELMGVDAEQNVLWVRGSVPGPKGSFVLVRQSKTRQ